MKDEEMAEEYKKQFIGVRSLFSFSDIEQAFLEGLKAGRPQWHDLRENPNDLPKEKQECLCKVNYYESEEVFNACLIYSPKLKGFYLDEEVEEDLFKISAWCEIPTFDKE